jgi:D-amino-acid oxidase
MNIAVIGGGFFGCYLTKSLNNHFGKEVTISIFDSENQLMTRAAANNQCRLHLGFHYPRSLETIQQTINGFEKFKNEFSKSIYFPKNNYYAVHQNSQVNFDDYIQTMNDCNLEFDICDKNQFNFFKKPNQIQGIIRVGEGVIKLQNLRDNLLSSISSKVYNHSKVSSIDCLSGRILVNGNYQGPFDYIINTTYVNPNLGLPKNMHYKLKYELAGMVLMKAKSDELAITIMDGNFVSLYPIGRGMSTLSSVVYTPFEKFNSVTELDSALKDPNSIARNKNVIENIIDHGNTFLNLENLGLESRGLWIAPKAKILNDKGSTRISHIKNYEKVISVLCGKLDSVHDISNQVISMIS